MDSMGNRESLGWVLLIALCLAVIAYSVCVAYQLGNNFRVLDEHGHFEQIVLFHQGHLELLPSPEGPHHNNAMIPGFHASLALLARIMDPQPPTVPAVRFNCFLISLLCFPVAYAVSESLGFKGFKDLSLLRAGQLYFLPLIFPFHTLVYNDMMSLVLVLTALLFCIRKRPMLCSGVMFAALLVRQINAAVAVFLLAYSYTCDYGITLSLKNLREHAARWWGLWGCVVSFIVFVVINGGHVGLDDPAHHPLVLSNLNLRFSLLCYFVLFLPWNLVQWASLENWKKLRPWHGVVIIVAAAILSLYDSAAHYWNLDYFFLLRNDVLWWSASSWYGHAVTWLMCALALASLAMTPLVNPSAALLYPFWFLMLLPELLVEPRYHIIPFALFLLFRKPAAKVIEVALLVWFVGISQGLEFLLWNGYLL
jgi:hypothetical protein